MSAWYSAKLRDFVNENTESIAGVLSKSGADRNLAINPETLMSWRNTIEGLRKSSNDWISANPSALDWSLLLEYEVPRRSKRIDAVILAHDIVGLVEFKDGAAGYARDARWQAEQYALDIRDFHAVSRGKKIVPFLVATSAENSLEQPQYSTDMAPYPLACVNFDGLTNGINRVFSKLSKLSDTPIVLDDWNHSSYKPTPWIVEAAREIFNQNDIREIRAAESHNLDETVACVIELIDFCQQNQKHGIAFITGAPGSGKTLAGLQVVHSIRALDSNNEALAVFLSGNRPLVEVIRESLSIDAATHGQSKKEMSRIAATFVQHAYQFRDHHVKEVSQIPEEHVILFDEAQRAWDAKQVGSKTNMDIPRSEPELFLDIMGRRSDWSVIIAVVGSGQEINRGEAGLGEWGRAILYSDREWVVRASPQVVSENPNIPGGTLLQQGETYEYLTTDERLHLEMNLRSPRAERLNHFVDAVINLEVDTAKILFKSITDFPIFVTRDLAAAKQWLKDRTDVDHRCGLVANTSARRLRAWGLDTKVLYADAAWANWFLKPQGDIRSSHQLEVPATNFDCQGLELDWVGMCWGNDVTVNSTYDSWVTNKLSGTTWQSAKGDQRRFMLNSYRVLLTRARKGMVIWIPNPDTGDVTMDVNGLNRTADMFAEIGVPSLDII